jgi:hypothetical protein
VFPRHQRELNTQGFLSVSTSRNPGDLNQVSMRACNGSSSAYPLVMIGVVENISHSMVKLCWSNIMPEPRLLSVCQ